MNILRSTLILLYTTGLFSQEIQKENNWIFDKLTFYVENDVYFNTDDAYSNGLKATALYFLPHNNNTFFNLLGLTGKNTDDYLSFSFANEIYTPSNTLTKNLIVTDRPYAGWTYLETSLQRASKDELRSLSLKVGMIGAASGSEQLQNQWHRIINVEKNNGWQNQLKNEIGVNLKYTQKWRFQKDTQSGLQTSLIPYLSADLGNVAIKGSFGLLSRIGWNIPKDFGISTMKIGSDSEIFADRDFRISKKLGFCFNLAAGGSLIAKDIFLDGNTFTNSHFVQKKPFVAYFGVGTSLLYQNIIADMMIYQTTKEFDLQKKNHTVGTLTLSYLF